MHEMANGDRRNADRVHTGVYRAGVNSRPVERVQKKVPNTVCFVDWDIRGGAANYSVSLPSGGSAPRGDATMLR